MGPVTNICEHGNEQSGKFIDLVSNCLLLKKNTGNMELKLR